MSPAMPTTGETSIGGSVIAVMTSPI